MYPYSQAQYVTQSTMKLPICVEGVNRQDRGAQMAEMKAAGVNIDVSDLIPVTIGELRHWYAY